MKQVYLVAVLSASLSFNVLSQPKPVDSTKKPAPITDTVAGNVALVWTKVEQEASFPGGVGAWTRYMEKSIHWDVAKKNKAPNGMYRVIAKFIVSKDGKIYNVVCETNHGYGLEEEVIRVIKGSPEWTPAMLKGKPVNAYRRQPVTFVIE